jgi:glycopeptide antibiotics resistance protein
MKLNLSNKTYDFKFNVLTTFRICMNPFTDITNIITCYNIQRKQFTHMLTNSYHIMPFYTCVEICVPSLFLMSVTADYIGT